MKLSKWISASLTLMLSLSICSCTAENLSDTSSAGISFAAAIGQTENSTRMSSGLNNVQTFTEGDQIGLYAVRYTGTKDNPTAQSLQAKDNSADNACYTATGEEINLVFNSTFPIRFPSGELKLLDLYAYYPYVEGGFKSESTKLPISIKTDQSKAENFWLSDFMTAEETKVDQKKATTSEEGKRLVLQFSHRLSLVHFEIQQGDQFTSLDQLTNPSLKVINLNTQVTWDWTAAETNQIEVLPNTVATITPYGSFSKGSGTFSGVSALLIPQSISKETPICEVKAAGMTFQCKLSTDFTLESGRSYIFTLTLNKSEISGVAPTITPWKTNIINKELKPDYPEITD